MHQLPLDLRWRPSHQLDDFVFAEHGTRELLQQAMRKATPVFLQGPAGSGKTTLLHALAHSFTKQAGVCDLNLPGAAVHILQAPHAIFDGLDAMSPDAEAALFARFNQCHDARAIFLVASRCGVDQLQIALPDLRSRLAQCLQISLPRLQEESARRQVLRTQADSFGLHLSDDMLAFFEAHVARDLAALAETLAYLHQESLSRAKPLTLAQARRALKQRARPDDATR